MKIFRKFKHNTCLILTAMICRLESVTFSDNPYKMSELPQANCELVSMKELVTPNIEIEEEENNANEAPQTDIDYGQVLTDIRNMRKHFKLKDFLMNASFGLAPSAWDIATDFSFAEKLEHPEKLEKLESAARMSLLFIALPGIVYCQAQL